MKYFKDSEFTCKCGCGRTIIDLRLGEKLDKLREKIKMPLVVSSGYRCQKHNAKVSTTGKNGPHTTGKAVDIVCTDREMGFKLIRLAFRLNFTGIGASLSDGKPYFVHLDILENPRPRFWSY
jgi:uncharacterized protein YcbK (DUF882 family)